MSAHGPYRGRLSDGYATDCEDGYTIWHLIAAGLYAQAELRPFLLGTTSLQGDLLLDDLREAMTVFPYHCAWRYEVSPTLGYNYDEFRALTAFRTPREICRLRATPFLAEYFVRREWLHPVLTSFRTQTIHDLNLNEWSVPPLH